MTGDKISEGLRLTGTHLLNNKIAVNANITPDVRMLFANQLCQVSVNASDLRSIREEFPTG